MSIAAVAELKLQNFKLKQMSNRKTKVEPTTETAIVGNTVLAFRYYLSSIKVQFKAAAYVNCFKIIPTIQITYSGYRLETGFAIEFTWGKWGIGWRFIMNVLQLCLVAEYEATQYQFNNNF